MCCYYVLKPYLGLMQSPEEFAKGVGLGTTSLIRNVAGGALTSGIGKCSLNLYIYVYTKSYTVL